jgi:hypothetical protein
MWKDYLTLNYIQVIMQYKVILSIVSVLVLFLGSFSSIAHHNPHFSHQANWTVYEGSDGIMDISEDELSEGQNQSPEGNYQATVYVEVSPGAGDDFCTSSQLRQPDLYDSEGNTNPVGSTNPNDDYYLESCKNGELLLPLFKNKQGYLVESNVCLVEIGFVWLRDNDTYEWDSHDYLFVLDPSHREEVWFDLADYGGCIDEDKGGIDVFALIGLVAISSGIIGGLYWMVYRKAGSKGRNQRNSREISKQPEFSEPAVENVHDEGNEKETEKPFQQSESSEPAVVNDQSGGLLEKNESNQEQNEGVRYSKFCPSCGLSNESNGKFCKDCGTNLSA